MITENSAYQCRDFIELHGVRFVRVRIVFLYPVWLKYYFDFIRTKRTCALSHDEGRYSHRRSPIRVLPQREGEGEVEPLSILIFPFTFPPFIHSFRGGETNDSVTNITA